MAVIPEGLRKFFRRGRPRHEPQRESLAWPNLNVLGQASPAANRIVYKPTPRNLRFFGRTPIAHRAINAIKMPLSMLKWEIVPIEGVDANSEIERQIDLVTRCFMQPNRDDNFLTFTQQVVEDILTGAGAIEINSKGGDPERPVWLWPVDGLSIHIFPGWAGGRNEARYLQTVGYGSYSVGAGQGVQLRDDELIYIRPNPTTAMPFGYGPLEIAFNSIARQLATGQFAGKLASNARPSVMLDLGDVEQNYLNSFRKYWTNEIEGEGKMPITASGIAPGQTEGKSRGATVLRLFPEGDNALFLKYQEFLRTEIAAAFDISNQNLNMERDVNRNTAEVMENKDWDNAIKPMAALLKSHFDDGVIRKGFGFSQIEFRFEGLDREDELQTANIHKLYYDMNVLTANQIRDKLGEPQEESVWGDRVAADIEIAKLAARGSKLIFDPELPQQMKVIAPPPDADSQGAGDKGKTASPSGSNN